MSKSLKIFIDSLKLAEDLDRSNNGINRCTVMFIDDHYYINNTQEYNYTNDEKVVTFNFIYNLTANELTFGIKTVSTENSKKVMSAFKKFLGRKSQGKIMIDLIAHSEYSYRLLLRGNIDFIKEFIASRIEYVEEFYQKGTK